MNKFIEYTKLHLISLEQDSEKINLEMTNPAIDLNSEEYAYLETQDISTNGQIIATRHLLEVAKELEVSA